MTITSDNGIFGIINETVAGTTPTTPAFQLLRITGESISFAPQTVNSSELAPGRGITDSILTGGEVSGDINFELSKNPGFEILLANLMCNGWGDVSPFLSGAMPVGWDSNWIFVGDNIQTMTYAKLWDIDGDPTNHYFPGCMVGGGGISITPGEPITGTMNLLGNTLVVRETEYTTQTEITGGVNPVMTAPNVVQAGFFALNGSTALPIALSTHCFNAINININNNARAIQCIGSLGARERALGKCEVTVDASIYFNDSELLNMLLARTEFFLKIGFGDTLTTPAHHAYNFWFPRCKINSCTVNAGGTGQDVIAEMQISALVPTTVPNSPLLIQRVTS